MSDAGTEGAAGAGAAAAATAAAAAASATADFLAAIPEDIRGDASLRDIKDAGTLARSYINQGKLLGVPKDQLLRLPAAADDAAGWGEVHNRLGRPETADKYVLADPAPDKIPPGLAVNAERKTAFAAKAHELGLSQRQAAALYEWDNSGRIAAFSADLASEAEGLTAAEATLKAEWGNAYPAKYNRMEEAVTLLDRELKLGGQLGDAIRQMPAASRVALAKAFERIRGFYQEDTIVGRGASGGAGALSPAEVQQEIGALHQDSQFMAAYRNQRAPGHDQAVQRMAALYQQLVPQTEAAQ